MEIVVDRDLCVGHGICESIAAHLFAVGDDGTVDILRDDILPEALADAESAVAGCPSRALRLRPRNSL
ncbi:ferredoxin [Nocardia sp. NPDC050406]|uniref:ferredoxin n=1 Tax=Nocardia sp. NPDC050406 TaxID=3364318 RepID=UPI0037A7B3E5